MTEALLPIVQKINGYLSDYILVALLIAVGLYKEPCGGGRYRYASSARSTGCDFNDRLQRILRECSLSVDYAQNLVVLKTMPGLASAAGAAFDAMDDLPAMIGCVCGDDTVLVVMRDEASAQSFCEELSGLCK